MSQIEKLVEVLKTIGYKASAWKGQRVYINDLGRDISAYFIMDDPESTDFSDPFEGCALKVYSNCNQGHKWLINRAKEVKHGIMTRIVEEQASTIFTECCENWQDVVL